MATPLTEKKLRRRDDLKVGEVEKMIKLAFVKATEEKVIEARPTRGSFDIF